MPPTGGLASRFWHGFAARPRGIARPSGVGKAERRKT
jgi:hypothetical protein